MSKLMEKEVRAAAVKGDLTIFSNKNHELLLKKTYQNDNIIHIAAQHQQFDFIKAALNSFPSSPTCESLFLDQNCNGDTPLHIVAQVGEYTVMELLYEFFSTHCGSDRVFPWRMVNSDGNTPAHVSLLYGNLSLAMYLVEKDASLARITNQAKETLLHLAIQYHVYDDPKTEAISSSNENVLMPIVEALLKIECSLSCWANKDGSTALHQASLLDPTYCIPVILAMLASSPEAAAVKDERSEHTILHLLTNHQVTTYDQGIELMKIPEVYALLNIKDQQGDTPLHLAARNGDKMMVRVLLEFSPKLGLKNKSGVSLRSLHQQLQEMRIIRRKLTAEECEAARSGNVTYLKQKLDSLGMDFLVSQTHTDGNIFHPLLQYANSDAILNAIEFIKEAIQMLPLLTSQQDRSGNTLLHVILERKFAHQFEERRDYFIDFCMFLEKGDLDHAKSGPHPSAFRVKNVNGDTPLHIAVRYEYFVFAIRLLGVDSEVACFVNNCKETPLHLLSAHTDFLREDVEELMDCMINENVDPNIFSMQDKDGLTPLLVAVRDHNLWAIKLLYKAGGETVNIVDLRGRTLWHWFGYGRVEVICGNGNQRTDIYQLRFTWESLIDRSAAWRSLAQMIRQDNDGNTALHVAITNKQFSLAEFLITNGRDGYIARLLKLENKDGISSLDLIGSAEHLPPEFEKFLFLEGIVLSGHRSFYGIPTTKIEAYTNTIGVVAALLATITFTAAFTVPGGLNSSNGTPLLARNAMFQVFMVADVAAMSSSVTVLFCLLWIMTTKNKRESILLLDVSVFLLQTSFYSTLATFMTGFYVTTISVVPAIAISTCVICTSLIIFLNKKLVMLTIVPLFGALITWVPLIIRHPIKFVCALLEIIITYPIEFVFFLWEKIKEFFEALITCVPIIIGYPKRLLCFLSGKIQGI